MAAMLTLSGCHKKTAGPEPAKSETETVPAPAPKVPEHPYAKVSDYTAAPLSRIEMPSGLIIEELRVGDGPICLPRANVKFHYRAKVKDGKEFDATAERPDGPAPQESGLSRLMEGLRDGMVGMNVGGRRRLTIPSEQAFSWMGAKDAEGNQVVAPGEDVVFIVDLLDVQQGLVVPSGAGRPAAK